MSQRGSQVEGDLHKILSLFLAVSIYIAFNAFFSMQTTLAHAVLHYIPMEKSVIKSSSSSETKCTVEPLSDPSVSSMFSLITLAFFT